jgi:PilZ domain-containing protein
MPSYTKARRWQRYQMDAPVQVVLRDGTSRVRVPGRVAEISAGGMGLYAGIHLRHNEHLEIEFLAPAKARVTGIVRSCAGCFFGLEFVTPLPVQDESRQPRKLTVRGQARTEPNVLRPHIVERSSTKISAAMAPGDQKTVPPAVALFRRTHSACLRQKELQMQRLRDEIEALRRAAELLEGGKPTANTSQAGK